jgi:hypothetical protein
MGHILCYLRSTVFLEKSDNLLASQQFNTWDGLFISDGNTDLRRRHTLLSHGHNQINDGFRGVRDPFGGSSFEGSHG